MAVVLQSVQRNAQGRDVDDSEEVTRFEICNPNEGEAAKPSSTESMPGWSSMLTRERFVSVDVGDKRSAVERNCTLDEAEAVF